MRKLENTPQEEEADDANRREILYYAGGNIESGLTGQYLNLVHTLLIIALGMSPLLLGVILSIKTLWAGLCDPVIAHFSDHAKTRWGRRHPFIFLGSMLRLIVLIAMIAFFPKSEEITPNRVLAEQNYQESGEISPESPPTPAKSAEAPKTFSISILRESLNSFASSDTAYKKKVAIYLLVCSIIFTTLGSFANVPYYALGLELCQSYDGRTRLITCKAFVDKIMSLLEPWVLPFCLLPIFLTFLDGLFWYGILTTAIGVPTTILMLRNTRERSSISSQTEKSKRPPLLKSIWMTVNNVHYLKILLLYQFFGYTIGVFAQLGMFLNIYWVYSGNALAGATLNGYVSTFATVLAFLSLPLVTWACRRFQKHRVLKFTICWMSLGIALRWFLILPEYPYLQLFLPFFFSIGVSSFYLTLSTMMADVTDIDELRNGIRREAMFGAAMGFCMKITGTLQPVLAGAVLVASGFDIALGANQTHDTFQNMRLLFSYIPAVLLLLGILILWRYPLTREHTEQIKVLLRKRRSGPDTSKRESPQA